MDPVALGLAAAAVVGKAALAKVGGQAGDAGWVVLDRVADRLREWFHSAGRENGVAALGVVEAAPDSEVAQHRLAVEVTEVVREPVRQAELERLLEEISEQGGPAVANFVTEVRDRARVGRVINVAGNYREGGSDG